MEPVESVSDGPNTYQTILSKVHASASEEDESHQMNDSSFTDENNSLMSDQSEDVFSNEMTYEEYYCGEEDCDIDIPETPMNSVLLRLDSLLREKINLEVKDFQGNLHSILNKHFTVEQKVLQLSQASSSNVDSSQESNSRSSSGIGSDSYSTAQPKSLAEPRNTLSIVNLPQTQHQSLDHGFEKNKKLIELFTSAAIISSTLRRPEFNT